MPENGQKPLQLATLQPAPLCYPLTPLLKITAALSALGALCPTKRDARENDLLASKTSKFAYNSSSRSTQPILRLGAFLSRPYGFSKTTAQWDRASTPAARLKATAQAASQASPRLKHICACRRVLASRQSPPAKEGDLTGFKCLVKSAKQPNIPESTLSLKQALQDKTCFPALL